MAAETGFTINGNLYETPESLTTAEWRILKRYTGLTAREISANAETLGGDPDWLAAMMHIAYRREHREDSFETVENVVGDQDFTDAIASLAGEEEDDALPPESTIEPDRSSPNGSVESKLISGTDSKNDSDPQEKTLEATGTGRSATSSPLQLAKTQES